MIPSRCTHWTEHTTDSSAQCCSAFQQKNIYVVTVVRSDIITRLDHRIAKFMAVGQGRF